MRRLLLLFAGLAAAAGAAEWRLIAHPPIAIPGARIEDAVLDGSTLYAWGDRVVSMRLPDGELRISPAAGVLYSAGGAVTDVDADGRPDLVLCQTNPAQLVWLRAPAWTPRVIAPGIQTRDVLAATILRHRGVLVVHKQMQVRFYEIPAHHAAPWPSSDLYSFYTPSREGGLAMADIDSDGLPDILCGNDWIRSPLAFDLHWRLFAINTWNELENSAMLRLAYGGGILVAGQREMSPARLAWFERPAGDPTPQWPQHAIPGDWDRIHSVQLVDFGGAGKPDLLVADAHGVFILRAITGEKRTVAAGRAIRAFAADVNGDGRPDVVVVRPGSVSWWQNVAAN